MLKRRQVIVGGKVIYVVECLTVVIPDQNAGSDKAMIDAIFF
jgi:hypothetical protein